MIFENVINRISPVCGYDVNRIGPFYGNDVTLLQKLAECVGMTSSFYLNWHGCWIFIHFSTKCVVLAQFVGICPVCWSGPVSGSYIFTLTISNSMEKNKQVISFFLLEFGIYSDKNQKHLILCLNIQTFRILPSAIS